MNRSARSIATALLVVLAPIACAPGEAPSTSTADAANPDAGTTTTDAGALPAVSSGLGIVVIDVQDTFVQGAATPDIGQVIANTKTVLELAGQHRVPLLISFEGSKDAASGHALPAELAAAVPSHAQQFVKTTFAATSLPAFRDAIERSGLTHLIVLGAETDVCVLQTVLGLRAMGLTVMLQTDAVFSSESNPRPALRRMQQAGVLLVDAAAVKAQIEAPDALPESTAGDTVTIIDPLHVAAVLDGFDDESIAASTDANKTAKLARLRELLLISEWFDIPLYGTPTSIALPARFAGVISAQIRPLSELADNKDLRQLVVAGSDHDLANLAAALGDTRALFVVEDALLAAGSADRTGALEALYQGGAVPITYKSLYYGMIKSVDLDQWPSPTWVERDPVYYPKTQAPEDLPPIKP